MSLTFRPAVEQLDARDLPAVTIQNAWVSSVQPAPQPAEVAFVAPASEPVAHAGYDLKAMKKV
jgi:hypothetical protein